MCASQVMKVEGWKKNVETYCQSETKSEAQREALGDLIRARTQTQHVKNQAKENHVNDSNAESEIVKCLRYLLVQSLNCYCL